MYENILKRKKCTRRFEQVITTMAKSANTEKENQAFKILKRLRQVSEDQSEISVRLNTIMSVIAEEMGYAPSVKMYKEDSTLYKGHIGDVCEMIRHLLTGRVKTPNLYQLLKIIGINEFKNRVEFYKN